jgi:hypothetical protein
MLLRKIQFNPTYLDKYILNDCKIYDRKTMNMNKYFLEGKIEHINSDGVVIIHPSGVGKTEKVPTLVRPVESSKSIIQQSGNSENYSRINLAENNQVSVKQRTETENNNISDRANNNFIKSKFGIERDVSLGAANGRVEPSEIICIEGPTLVKPSVVKPTVKDYEELQLYEQVLYDKRKFSEYTKEAIVKEHRIVSLFKRSALTPFFIKMNKLVFEFSMGLAINALLYTADYIDTRATDNDKVILNII